MFGKLVLLSVVCLAVQPSAAAPQKGRCSDEALREKCIQSLFLVSGDRHFPNTTKELDTFCARIKETDKCVKDYTRDCVSKDGRRAVEVAVAGISRMVKRMCRSSARKQEFVKHSKCGNEARADMRSCLRDYKMALYGAKQAADNQQKLGILCCKFHAFRGCVRNGFDRIGQAVCPDESRHYFANIAGSFQSDVFDLICSNFEEGSAQCAAIVVPPVPASEDTKSLIRPLRDVIRGILAERNKE